MYFVKGDDYNIGPFALKLYAQEWLTNLEDTFPEFFNSHSPWQLEYLDDQDSLMRYLGRVS